MKARFDLLQSPWIPCIRRDGRPDELGLRDLLVQAHELREIGGESSLVMAALHRLLLAVLHGALGGPADSQAWARLWDAGRWDAERVDAYLERWRHRFDLFDAERPFFQAPDERAKPKSVTSLMYEVASGNNPTLFDHHTDEEGLSLTPAQAARMLVTAQCFGLAGLAGPGLPNFTDGACARGIVFLVQGDTVFQTLALNLLPYPADEVMLHSDGDRPAWEMDDAFTPERTRPLGYLDYLTWQNRRVLFLPEETGEGVAVREMTLAPALRLDSDVLDPMTHYRSVARQGWRPLVFTQHRALWRDSTALLRLRDEDYRTPRTFNWLAEIVRYEQVLERAQTRQYLALGMSSVSGQQKVNFYRTERMPLPLRYLEEEHLVESLEVALEMAEKASAQLWSAARRLATLIVQPKAEDRSVRLSTSERQTCENLEKQWAIEQRYWPFLELPFRDTMVALPRAGDSVLENWRKVLWGTAWEAFEQIAENLSQGPRTIKAVVLARQQLGAGLGKALPKE
ncbi:MAG: type I-E CRISPR-associated protein Cse1/CasA [Anaerolineae bacterium]|nr:type I-E CRISPR-associated protein Cse1/CasA [Anaerolineae bacterium]